MENIQNFIQVHSEAESDATLAVYPRLEYEAPQQPQ